MGSGEPLPTGADWERTSATGPARGRLSWGGGGLPRARDLAAASGEEEEAGEAVLPEGDDMACLTSAAEVCDGLRGRVEELSAPSPLAASCASAARAVADPAASVATNSVATNSAATNSAASAASAAASAACPSPSCGGASSSTTAGGDGCCDCALRLAVALLACVEAVSAGETSGAPHR